MAICDDDDIGYRTRSISCTEVCEYFPYTHRFNYLQDFVDPKQYYLLIDRLFMNSPDFKILMDTIESISPTWVIRLKSQLINEMIKKYIIYLRKPQQFNHSADMLFAANYSMFKYKLQRTSKAIHVNHKDMKYINLNVKRSHLVKMSKLFARVLLPVAMDGMKAYGKYEVKYLHV